MSRSKKEELTVLKSLLADNGCIGLTYFADNIHVRNIRQQIQEVNVNFFKPFSLEAKRLIHLYLEANKMETLATDQMLMSYLGAEPVERVYPPSKIEDVIPSVNWTGFKMDVVKDLLIETDLEAFAWLPSAYSHPYGKSSI